MIPYVLKIKANPNYEKAVEHCSFAFHASEKTWEVIDEGLSQVRRRVLEKTEDEFGIRTNFFGRLSDVDEA
jgi:hypothetical protein